MTDYAALYLTENEAVVLLTYARPGSPVEFGITTRGTTLSRTPGNEWAYDAVRAAREEKRKRDEAITVEHWPDDCDGEYIIYTVTGSDRDYGLEGE